MLCWKLQTSNAGITRREVNLAGFSAALAFVAAAPAQAFLGFGGPPKDDVYKAETVRTDIGSSVTVAQLGVVM